MNFLEKNNKNYPDLLRGISDAPKKLYYRGKWDPEIFENCLAVVGSRRLTTYGRRAAEQLVGQIAACGITIVSGFMYGGDAAAHKSALQAGGKTIAVMPCGIERIHPAYQKDLYEQILKNDGLVISEYGDDRMPLLWMYPRRNRIVAGLSKAILVLEAALDSGTLITADYAKKFKRKIFAVPGQYTSEVSRGALKLIKEGAEAVTCAKDVISYFGLGDEILKSFPPSPDVSSGGRAHTPRFQNLPLRPLSDSLEQKIIGELRREPMEIDDLARNLEVRTSELGAKLSMLQIKGIINQEGNKYYAD